MVNKSTDHIASLAKGLRVLECFSADAPRLSITEVASATGLDRATARRCLLTLHHEGYADYDGKFFALTHRAMRLGMGAIAAMPLSNLVQPWLDQLAQQMGQSCSVAILDETEIVYIARAAQTKLMAIGLMPGSRLPAHCTSLGQALLAHLPEDEARARIDASDLAPRTIYSRTEPEAIMERLAEVRRLGYALNDQEVEIGLRALAVILRDSQGRVVAALNTGMAATQARPEEVVQTYLPALQRTQTGLQRIL